MNIQLSNNKFNVVWDCEELEHKMVVATFNSYAEAMRYIKQVKDEIDLMIEGA